ncbi:MAG: hypothetical protein Q4G64_09405 [bacterium]|nr:hypothetical protein [bacterium]
MAPELAGRIRRPSWRDPRLGIGIVLVALSVALGTWAVANAGKTVPVWSVSRTVTPGEVLQPALVAVDVSPNLEGSYLSAIEAPAGVSDRVIHAGELVPASAVVDPAALDIRTVVVAVDAQLSPAVVAGSRVDLWLSPESGEPAQQVLEDLVVRALVEQAGALTTRATSVELVLTEAQVGTVITAMNEGGNMVIVPRVVD